MDLQAVFSDNQLAVLGCFVALGFCGGIAALSFHFGQAGKNPRSRDPRTPATASVSSAGSGITSTAVDTASRGLTVMCRRRNSQRLVQCSAGTRRPVAG